MKANKAFCFVVGLIVLGFIEGLVKHFCAGFPIIEVLGFQATAAGAILTSKVFNDLGEMKYGIRPKAGTMTTVTNGSVETSETEAKK